MTRTMLAPAFALALALGVAAPVSAQDIDCPDVSPEDAQAILEQDPSDPNGLDADGDGFACEFTGGSGGGGGGSAAPAPAAEAPVAAESVAAAPAAPVTNLPRTGAGQVTVGGNGPALALLAVVGAFGLAGLRARRDRR